MNLNKTQMKKILVATSAVMFAAALIFVVVLLAMGFSGKLASNDGGESNSADEVLTENSTGGSEAGTSPAAEPTEEPTAAPVTYSEITLLSAGDLMLYGGQVDSAKSYGGGEYDFFETFRYLQDIIQSHDYSVVNFEATVSDGNFKYYPTFRVPEAILDYVKSSGFDNVLFANNHTYDNGRQGLLGTQQALAERGLSCIGTRLDTESESYMIADINGVKLGLLNYTYEAPPADERYSETEAFLNGIRLEKYCPACGECIETSQINADKTHKTCGSAVVFSKDLIDSFNPYMMDSFYQEINARIDELTQEGADMIVVYLHWGNEYEHSGNAQQKEIAQKLCDMGVDLLIGSHPHVVQPVEGYTSADGSHSMLCYYSLGNFVSGQNRAVVGEESKEKYTYTENGLLASVTIRKYSTGETVISSADYVPTWMHRHSVGGRVVFNVVPLGAALESDASKEAYGLNESSFGVSHATAAYEYITGLVKPGVDAFNDSIVLPYAEEEV